MSLKNYFLINERVNAGYLNTFYEGKPAGIKNTIKELADRNIKIKNPKFKYVVAPKGELIYSSNNGEYDFQIFDGDTELPYYVKFTSGTAGNHWGNSNAKSGDGPAQVSFAGGGNTKMGESLQTCGFFMNITMNSEFDYNGKNFKKLLSLLSDSNLNLSDGSGFKDKYLKDEKTFNRHQASIFSILYASSIAGKSLNTNLKFSKALHNNINSYYALSKEKNLVDMDINKDNTADCLLYSGSNLINNIKNPDSKIVGDTYNIKVIIDGKVTNEYLQISLKSGGRIGDSPTFTQISSKFKYNPIIEGMFRDMFTKISKTVSSVFLKMTNFVKNLLSKAKKNLKKTPKEFSNIATNLFYNDKLIKETFKKFPNEDMIFEKYSDKKELKKLLTVVDEGLAALGGSLDAMGPGVIYKIPKYKTPSNPSKESLRFLYFNAVSILTMNEYIKSIGNPSDFQKLETEIVFGNTLLPLIKVFTDPTSAIEYLPIKKEKSNVNTEIPIFGAVVNNTKDYLSFYIYILSDKPSEIEYLRIQMRTKGNQYVVDGQAYLSYEKFQKVFK